jgi:hypothetical protein
MSLLLLLLLLLLWGPVLHRLGPAAGSWGADAGERRRCGIAGCLGHLHVNSNQCGVEAQKQLVQGAEATDKWSFRILDRQGLGQLLEVAHELHCCCCQLHGCLCKLMGSAGGWKNPKDEGMLEAVRRCPRHTAATSLVGVRVRGQLAAWLLVPQVG